jgi:hypothetical protein
MKTLRGYSQTEIKMREIDRRHPGLWGPSWRRAERIATAKRIAALRIAPVPLVNVPLHQAERGADFNAVPRGSEIIHRREVLDLLPVIEDQHFDPLFDGWGSFDPEQVTGDWLKAKRPSVGRRAIGDT